MFERLFIDLAEPASMSELRITLGKSLAAVAREMKISHATLKRWEQGLSYPSIDQYMKLCNVYGVDCNLISLGFSEKRTRLFKAIDLVKIAQAQGLTCKEFLKQPEAFSCFKNKVSDIGDFKQK